MNLKLLDIAKASNNQMVNLFAESQSNICKKTCIDYSSSQNNAIVDSIKNKEDLESIDAVSPFVIDDKIVELNRELLAIVSGEYYL